MGNEDIARKNLLREGEEASGLSVAGHEFNEGGDLNKIISNFGSQGFQATHLARAIGIINTMNEDNAFVFLGYTSNMVSSGNRDIIRWLVEHRRIGCLVSSAGGIEEDIIKCLGDFVIGDFHASGKELREKGINRIGNIFVPNNRYVQFEEFVQNLLEDLYSIKKIWTPSELIWELGKKIENKESIYYWAYKNKTPVYCPAITDGALGDNIYFFKFKHADFVLDIAEDVKSFNDLTIGLKKSGAIILGSGIIKHAILNANMLRNGLDYAVYINTSAEYDGSDSGAMPDEAVSWGKILPKAESVKVFGDATILFPIIVSQTFSKTK